MTKSKRTEIFLTQTNRRTVIRKASVRAVDGSDEVCSTTTTTTVIEEERSLSFQSVIVELLPRPLRQPGAPAPCAVSGCRSVGRRKSVAWEMTEDAFRTLLARLDADWDRAGEKYALLRRKLAKFFECRGCHTPAELADETINRVARRLVEGEEILAFEPERYFYGVARNVLREYQESSAKQLFSLDDLSPAEHPRHDPIEARARAELRGQYERQLEQLETCLEQLPPAHRDLLLEYYRGEQRGRIEGRRELAARLGITVNALKIRVFRLRDALARRLNDLLAQQGRV